MEIAIVDAINSLKDAVICLKPPSSWLKDISTFIISISAIVAVIRVIKEIGHQKQLFIEGQNLKERDDIRSRVKFFLGPFSAIRSESRTLYSYFALDEKTEATHSGSYFRTLRHLTEGKDFSKQDTAIQGEILQLGRKQLELIEKEGGAITNPHLLGLLGLLGAHIRVLLLAAEGKLNGFSERLNELVFPLEVDGAIETEIRKLQDRYQQLLSPNGVSKKKINLGALQQQTVSSYNLNYKKYYRDTAYIDLSDIYKEFRKHIARGGMILDAGCGVGRDTRYFIQHGYKVVSFDASDRMVQLCSQYPFAYCLQQSFADIESIEEFDAVWACASLLHLPEDELKDALLRLVNALKPKGVLYFSLKLGCQSSFREGKTYYFYQKEWVDTFVQKELMLEKIKIWQNLGKKTSDPVTWDNYLYKKT